MLITILAGRYARWIVEGHFFVAFEPPPSIPGSREASVGIAAIVRDEYAGRNRRNSSKVCCGTRRLERCRSHSDDQARSVSFCGAMNPQKWSLVCLCQTPP